MSCLDNPLLQVGVYGSKFLQTLTTKLTEDGKYFDIRIKNRVNKMVTDLESLLFLRNLVLSSSPHVIVETGSHLGIGTAVLYEAMSSTPSFSTESHRLLTVEKDRRRKRDIIAHLKIVGADDSEVQIVFSDSTKIDWKRHLGDLKVDLVFLDCYGRYEAYLRIEPYLSEKAIVVVHDWFLWDFATDFETSVRNGILVGPIVIATSRGLGVYQKAHKQVAMYETK